MEDALRLMDVPPDDIDSWLAAQAKDEAKRAAQAPKRPPTVAALPKPLPAPIQAKAEPALPRSLE